MQGGDLRSGGHLVDVQVYTGELVTEGAQQTGQDRQGEGGGETDPKAAGTAAADGPGCGQTVRQVGQCPPGGGQQFTAGSGEGDAPWGTREQRVADLLLQAADLLAQRRLGDAQAGGCVAEVEFLREHDEGMQLRQGKFGALHTPRDIRSCIRPY